MKEDGGLWCTTEKTRFGPPLGAIRGHRMVGKVDFVIHIPPGPILCHCCCTASSEYLLLQQKEVRAGCSHADPSGLYQGGEVRALAPGRPYCCQVAGYFLPPLPPSVRPVSYEP